MRGAIKWLGLAFIQVAALIALTPPASALLPPPLPPSYSAYGPLQLCTDRFVIDVAADEALNVVGDIAQIINDRELLAINFANAIETPPAGHPAAEAGQSAKGANRTRAAKLTTWRIREAAPGGVRTSGLTSPGLAETDIRYALASSNRMHDPIMVGATSFDGSSNDQRLLNHIKPPAAKRAGCLPLAVLFDQGLDINEARRARELANPGAATYPPAPDSGPLFHCLAGIGFPLEQGETLLRPWRPLRASADIFVNTGGSQIRIEQRLREGEGLQPGDPSNFDEHPLSFMRKTEVAYYPSRGVGPPYASPGQREPGSWAVKLIDSYDYGITFRFPDSERNFAGFRFMERLKFVKKGDPHCAAKS